MNELQINYPESETPFRQMRKWAWNAFFALGENLSDELLAEIGNTLGEFPFNESGYFASSKLVRVKAQITNISERSAEAVVTVMKRPNTWSGWHITRSKYRVEIVEDYGDWCKYKTIPLNHQAAPLN